MTLYRLLCRVFVSPSRGWRWSVLCAACLGLALAGPAWSGYADRPEAKPVIDKLVAEHDFTRTQVRQLLDDARYQDAIVKAMKRPAEALPWYRYRKIFIQQDRIGEGAKYLAAHADVLHDAQARYGVPAALITAIIGVETRYGRHIGTYRVLDALATLAFDYPPRADFFRSELEQFLILSREAHIDPTKVLGSYAGAMGVPQFIASSYRHYAVDFNKDGRTDLWEQPADVIGSVANYLAENGWARDKPVAFPAVLDGPRGNLPKASNRSTSYTAAELEHAGIRSMAGLAPDTPVGLLILDDADTSEYWVAMHNFYVITTYNRSPLYAMAVYQLSQAIEAAARRNQHHAD